MFLSPLRQFLELDGIGRRDFIPVSLLLELPLFVCSLYLIVGGCNPCEKYSNSQNGNLPRPRGEN